MQNYKYINQWLEERGIRLAKSFAETLRDYAREYKKKNRVNFADIYSLLGCSKQNVSYWENHCGSTQSRSSIYETVRRAQALFGLTQTETDKLLSSAGLSHLPEKENLIEQLEYTGKICLLSEKAMVSERMLRHYKKISDKTGADGYSDCFGLKY